MGKVANTHTKDMTRNGAKALHDVVTGGRHDRLSDIVRAQMHCMLWVRRSTLYFVVHSVVARDRLLNPSAAGWALGSRVGFNQIRGFNVALATGLLPSCLTVSPQNEQEREKYLGR